MVAGAYAKPCVSDVKLVADSVEDTAYGNEVRREAAQVNEAGKYEPKLTENGIPADVLAKLLPGDDVVELSEPVVGGGVAYRFVKRAFDVVSCGCALIVLAIPMGVIALKIKSDLPVPSSTRRDAWVRVGRFSTFTSSVPCIPMPRRVALSGRKAMIRV